METVHHHRRNGRQLRRARTGVSARQGRVVDIKKEQKDRHTQSKNEKQKQKQQAKNATKSSKQNVEACGAHVVLELVEL